MFTKNKNTDKTTVLPKVIYRFNTISIKKKMAFFIEETILKYELP